jgi:hypothetical protein
VPAQDFIVQLRDLGLDVAEAPVAQMPGQTIVRLPYTVPLGSKAGDEITLAFLVPPDFNLTCPSGPYMHPHVLPINQSNEPPYGGVSDASHVFGAEWQYWSRPYNGWATSDRDGRAYMRHVAHLFDLI